MQRVIMMVAVLALLGLPALGDEEPFMKSELLFPVEPQVMHHGSCIVEAPNGDVLICWYRGRGEKGHNVAVVGSRKVKQGGNGNWSAPFVMADTPGFPDSNPCMIVDHQARLWLFWPTLLARGFETAQMHYKISTNYCMPDSPPEWNLMENLFLEPDKIVSAAPTDEEVEVRAPGDFADVVRKKYDAILGTSPSDVDKARADRVVAAAGNRLTRRMGWFTRAHPKILEDGRVLVGLYSDLFDFSLVAITDDRGASWHVSDPIVGVGNVQPCFAQKKDGTIVAYMRDNGPPPKRVMVAESKDRGETWGPVYDHPVLPNPGAGVEVANLSGGDWICINNDLEEDRYSLAVSISEDEGKTWKWTRHLEKWKPGGGLFHYPSIIEGRDGNLHVSYTYTLKQAQQPRIQKSIKYATFNRAWVKQGD